MNMLSKHTGVNMRHNKWINTPTFRSYWFYPAVLYDTLIPVYINMPLYGENANINRGPTIYKILYFLQSFKNFFSETPAKRKNVKFSILDLPIVLKNIIV